MRSRINVTLLHATPLWIISTAIRTCRDNHHVADSIPKDINGRTIPHQYPSCLKVDYTEFDTMIMGDKDIGLIDNIANKVKHESTIEHVTFNFFIDNLPRNTLQELARHRIASYTVKSSRYTLKELKKVKSFFHDEAKDMYDSGYGKLFETHMDLESASKFVYLTGNSVVDSASVRSLESLREVVSSGISMDFAKFCMPESYLTELTFSINARSLKNLLKLRLAKDALFTIREMSEQIIEALPEEYKFLVIEADKEFEEDGGLEDGRNS